MYELFASVDCHFLIFQAAQFHHRCNRHFSNSPADSNDASSTFYCSGYSPVSLLMSKLPESEGKITKFLILLHSAWLLASSKVVYLEGFLDDKGD